LVRYSADGSWWWDGQSWRPTRPVPQPEPPGATMAFDALVLSVLIAAVFVPLLLIGIADSRNSVGFSPGLGELVFAVLVASPGVVLGTLALRRLPRDAHHRRRQARVAIWVGVAVSALLVLLIFA
jgi:hypothetical protein